MNQKFEFEVQSVEEGREILSFVHDKDKRSVWVGRDQVNGIVTAHLENRAERGRVEPRVFVVLQNWAGNLEDYVPSEYKVQL